MEEQPEDDVEVMKRLYEDIERMNSLFEKDAVRAFGSHEADILKTMEDIRQKQMTLALDQIRMESKQIPDLDFNDAADRPIEPKVGDFERLTKYFEDQEQGVVNMARKLDGMDKDFGDLAKKLENIDAPHQDEDSARAAGPSDREPHSSSDHQQF